MPAFTCPNCGSIVVYDYGEPATCEHCGWCSDDEATVAPTEANGPSPLEAP